MKKQELIEKRILFIQMIFGLILTGIYATELIEEESILSSIIGFLLLPYCLYAFFIFIQHISKNTKD